MIDYYWNCYDDALKLHDEGVTEADALPELTESYSRELLPETVAEAVKQAYEG